MLEIISLVLPFFSVIACGFLGARLISETGQQGLNRFVQYFALPALLFLLMARGELASRFEGLFVIAYTSTSIALAVISYLVFDRLFKKSGGEAALLSLGSVYGNIGYMGIPIIVLMLGPGASLPAIIALMIDVIIMIPLASAVIIAGQHNSGSDLLSSFGRTLAGTVRSPVVLAALLGAAVSLSGLSIPGSIDGFLDLLADAAAPCALFALGASLYGKPIGGNITPSLAVSLFKLIVHPALLLVSMTLIFEVDPAWIKPAVIAASLPVALTVYVVARQYEVSVIGASTTILLSTALSLLTVPLVMLVLGS